MNLVEDQYQHLIQELCLDNNVLSVVTSGITKMTTVSIDLMPDC